MNSFTKKIGLFAAFLGLTLLATLAPGHKTYAAGETYTWRDYRTIQVSGGMIHNNDTRWPLNLLTLTIDQGGAGLTGDQIGLLSGPILVNMPNGNTCTVDISIYVFKGNAQGFLWSPPPYSTGGLAPQGYPHQCGEYGNMSSIIQSSFHNFQVDIAGTRPQNPNAPERPDQKTFRVYVNAPDPQSTAPKTDTIYIYSADGKQQIMSLTAPFTVNNPNLGWPPDQNPMSLNVTFQDLNPGNYIVCDTYVAKNCTDPTKLVSGQKITKVRYDGNGSTSIGTLYQTPDLKRINAHVEYHAKRPCGSVLNVNPVTVTLTGPAGPNSKTYSQETNAGVSNPTAAESSGLCTVNVILGLYATFDNMPAGTYQACTAAATCVSVVKADGAAAEVTLVINDELVAPADQKVCTSGEGIAGALAWVICPATQVIASATDFFENHIITPFLTVSPLTTDSANPVYILWQDFRDLANVGFVVLLFVGIFSIALSRFGLKRLLPRLLIVVVGINLSYFVVAFIIDAFNIFGSGLSQLIMAAIQQGHTTQLNNGTSATPLQSIFVLGGAALLTIILTAGAALGWLFSFLGIAFLIIVITVIVLVLRQIAIIGLVIISPIAILLYLLPNTSDYFNKWRKLLIQLLMMYPMIALLFASGKILGFVLLQQDLFSNGDMPKEVTEAIRIIMQFLVYVIPLAFLPATFMASNSVMSRVYGGLHKRFVQPRAKQAKEDAARIAGEARMRVATNSLARKTGLGQLVGSGLNQQSVRNARQQNLQRAQQNYVASSMSGTGWASALLRRQAAGAAGASGSTRAAATAAATAHKAETEDLEAEKALLDQEMRRLGMDEDTFAGAVASYLEDPTDASKRVVTGSNGEKFDFAANADRLQRALLNSAASQGHVRAIEAARLNSNVNQNMLDNIIRRNDKQLKEHGGFHLATQFGLAAGRMQVHDPTTGALRAPANRDEMNAEMVAQRLVAMSQSGANSIAGMKYSLIADTAGVLRDTSPSNELRNNAIKIMDHMAAAENARRGITNPADQIDYRRDLRNRMDMILGNRQTLARADNDPQDFTDIRTGI